MSLSQDLAGHGLSLPGILHWNKRFYCTRMIDIQQIYSLTVFSYSSLIEMMQDELKASLKKEIEKGPFPPYLHRFDGQLWIEDFTAPELGATFLTISQVVSIVCAEGVDPGEGWYGGWYPGGEAKTDGVDARLAAIVPGLNEQVTCPVHRSDEFAGLSSRTCLKGTLKDMIIHLNDRCGWSREQVADWLESLDSDLSFPVQEERTHE